jgi:hypothetical protein
VRWCSFGTRCAEGVRVVGRVWSLPFWSALFILLQLLVTDSMLSYQLAVYPKTTQESIEQYRYFRFPVS